ncbi:MAG: DUF4115 domain-containing protein [Acidothermus sp.]|nr:DUF4115 domain-containing protein [Acidothermus sp.]MCL6537585.1 DUF4115 domain-containing protein [Acidothermus sp.]
MSIGSTIAEARERAGLSVEDLAAKTRLRAGLIRAIERDDFSQCGGHFYARAHLRELARVVGIDPAPLLAEYDAMVGPEDEDATGKLAETETASRSIAKTEALHRTSWGAAALGALLVVVIVVAAVQLFRGNSPQTPTGAALGSSSPAIAPSPTPSAPATPSVPVWSPSASPPTAAPSSAVAEAGVHVTVRVTTAKCWVLARASDGTTIFQGIMNPGDTQTFTDPQKLYLKLGNAPATTLVVNGVDVGVPPSTNDVASFTFGPGPPNLGQG